MYKLDIHFSNKYTYICCKYLVTSLYIFRMYSKRSCLITLLIKFQNFLYNTHNIFIDDFYKCLNTFASHCTRTDQYTEYMEEKKKIKRGEKDSLTFSMANKKHGRRRDNGCRILCPTPGTGFLITPQK